MRYSVEHPEIYIQSNLVGTSHVLQAAAVQPKHLLLASTSSVYGGNRAVLAPVVS